MTLIYLFFLILAIALLIIVSLKSEEEIEHNMKSKGTAYLLWLFSGFGWLGFHHFYLGKIGKGIIWIFTGGVFGIGSLIDLFTLGGAVDNYNIKQELSTIRTASLANLAMKKENVEKKKINEQPNKSIEPNVEIVEKAVEIPIKPKQKRQTSLTSSKISVSENKKSIVKIGGAIILLLIVVIFVFSLIEPNYSIPLEVIKRYDKYSRNGDLKKKYEHLSIKSQESYEDYNDFIEENEIHDSIIDKYKYTSIVFKNLPIEDSLHFRKIQVKRNIYDGVDSSNFEYTRTLVLEEEDWKIARGDWYFKQSGELFKLGDFKKSRELCYKAIEIDRFYSEAHNRLAWCYIRDIKRPNNWEDTIVFHLNRILLLDSLNSSTYNTIGAYYSFTNRPQKAVENFLTAIKYSNNDSLYIADFYSNAAGNAKSYNIDDAKKYIVKSLQYNQTSRYAWQIYGDLFYDNEQYRKAYDKYKKALSLLDTDNNIDNYTIISLYGKYALVCKKLGYKKTSQEYILKCVRVYPNHEHPIFKELDL